jgi:hypothetical protein
MHEFELALGVFGQSDGEEKDRYVAWMNEHA